MTHTRRVPVTVQPFGRWSSITACATSLAKLVPHDLRRFRAKPAAHASPGPYKVWVEPHVERLILTISDRALRAASDEISGDVELRVVHKLADARLGVAAVNAERFAGFPSGRLFLDSIERALAVALVNNYFRYRNPRLEACEVCTKIAESD